MNICSFLFKDNWHIQHVKTRKNIKTGIQLYCCLHVSLSYKNKKTFVELQTAKNNKNLLTD